MSRAVSLGAHVAVIIDDCIENRAQHASVRPAVGPEAIQDELGDGGVTYQVSPTQNLKVARHRGLRQVEHRLKIRNEQWRCSQAVQNSKPGRLCNCE